ncbi:hypothetical protein Trydic_g12927 [Trypoxylus dichotomus]
MGGRILEMFGASNSYVNSMDVNPRKNERLVHLEKQIKDLTEVISKLSVCKSRWSQLCYGSRSRSQSARRNSGMCWYHNKFGDKTKKCHAPCPSAAINEVAQSRRLFVTDKNNNIRFLVHSGAGISVLSYSKCGKHIKPAKRTLYAANGTEIQTYGEILLNLDLSLRRAFNWIFVIADVSTPIQGADFLSHFGLLVDIRDTCLRDTITQLQVNGIVSSSRVPSSVHTILPQHLRWLKNLSPPDDKHRKHNTQYQIQTTGSPVSTRARRLPPDKLAAAKLEFQHMVELGICRPFKSQWSSPLHMVPKRDGSWRPCG